MKLFEFLRWHIKSIYVASDGGASILRWEASAKASSSSGESWLPHRTHVNRYYEGVLEYTAAQQFLRVSQISSTYKGVRESGIHAHMSAPTFEYISNNIMFSLIWVWISSPGRNEFRFSLINYLIIIYQIHFNLTGYEPQRYLFLSLSNK